MPAARARLRPFRLPTDVRPKEVDLRVELDPARSAHYRGEVIHRLHLARGRRQIFLHADGLRVSHARLSAGGRVRRPRVVTHPDREALELRFAEALPAGDATLSLTFRGRLRQDLRGLYAARAGERRYAFTQLEAADARRFFPCFDEPAMKARFQIAVTTGSGHTVLSNSPVAKVEPLGGGRKTVHFERTPPLSTYLLALAVGELEASKPTHCGETEIRVWHVPGKGALTAFALETARETLSRLERYFDLPYPYEKLDLVAVPDFEAGAMENAGAVFFRETLLLVDPETATLQEKKRAAEVICHELAHMWYGNLVTMAWWDDLWLNEAFATWMAFHVVDAWKPEWKMWNDFQHHRSAALGLDALEHTHPIYTKVRTPADATENFDLITYEKGASVVRMIERYLGAETFRAGVRRYVCRHRESNAVAADLWQALAEASRQDVKAIVRPWIEQPGFPLLRLRRREVPAAPAKTSTSQGGEPAAQGRTELRFEQERFRARPGAARSRRAAGAEALWPIPWVGRIGSRPRSTRLERRLLEKRRERLWLDGPAPRFAYGNADEGGFFRPLHEPAELRALAAALAALGAVERMGLLGHQWAITRAGHAALHDFLDLALAFGSERDPDVLLALRGPLAFTAELAARALGHEAEGKLRQRVGDTFAPAFAALGFDAAARESDELRLRRAALLALAGEVAEHDEVVEEAAARCRAYLEDRRSLEPNLADAVVTLGARLGEGELFARFLTAAESATTPQERRRFLMGLGAFCKPDLVARALELSLDERVGTQDVALLLARMLRNRDAREATWAFMKRRWPALRRRMPPMLISRPIEATPALGTRAHRRDVAAFFRAHPVPTAKRAVEQALEHFDLDLAFEKDARPALARWLG
jgi:puromycin-sensitive aminopeptidase